MKKTIFFGLLFSSLLSQDFSLSFTSPISNLFFIHPGFVNSSQAEGVIGLYPNPASIAFSGKMEGFFAYTFPKQTTLEFDFPVALSEVGDFSFLQVFNIPISLNLEEKGGLQTAGAAFSVAGVNVGFAFMKDDHYGLDMNLNLTRTDSVTIKFRDNLSRADHDSIPLGVVIPMEWEIKGKPTLRIGGSGSAGIGANNFILSAGKGLGPIGIGAGIIIKRFSGNADGTYGLNSLNSPLIVSSQDTFQDLSGNPWNVDISISGNYNGSLFSQEITGDVSGNQLGFSLGGLIRLPLVRVGGAIEYNLPFSLKGSIIQRFIYPSEVIEGMINTQDIDVDTINRTITGSVSVDSIELFYSSLSNKLFDDSYDFPGLIGLRLGFGLDAIVKLKLGGGVDIPTRENAFGKFFLGANSGFGIPLPPVFPHINFGTVLTWRYFKAGVESFSLPPQITFGIGADGSFGPITLYLATHLNPTASMLALGREFGLEGSRWFNPFKLSAYSFGIRGRI